MKKVLMLMVVAIMGATLVACAPEGMSQNFYDKAYSVFSEIDDDTMELEVSDKDDKMNVDLLSGQAASDSEEDVVAAIEAMVALQAKVIDGDKDSIKSYLKERNKFYDAMDYGNMSRVNFEFKED